jgi:hypothetical protein
MSDEPKESTTKTYIIPSLGSAVSSLTVATYAFGADFWRSPDPPVKKPPPDNPIYSHIGQIASAWAHVEHTLDTIIWELASTNAELGACLTAQILGAYGRFKAIISLLTVLERHRGVNVDSAIAKTRELMNKSNDPGDKRNRVVHDPWYEYIALQQTAQFRAVPFKDFTYGITAVDKENLEGTLDSINKFADRVTNLRSEILSLLSASPKTPPAP